MSITISEPCNKKWNKMTPVINGRYCSSCNKTVTDFTKMDKQEILDYWKNNKEINACGRFLKHQLSNNEQNYSYWSSTFSNGFKTVLYFILGISLVSCFNRRVLTGAYAINTEDKKEIKVTDNNQNI